jgi:hypothetical protein
MNSRSASSLITESASSETCKIQYPTLNTERKGKRPESFTGGGAPNYSYRKDSMGSRLAAFHAG